jgi:hypothetical protein
MSDDFKPGNLVLYTGMTLKSGDESLVHYCLGVIQAVGKYEVFVRKQKGESYLGANHAFKVPKCNVRKIDRQRKHKQPEFKQPKIGDLVLHYSDQNFSSKPAIIKHGVLIEIKDVPGQMKSAKLRNGSKEFDVSYDNLIVLEH